MKKVLCVVSAWLLGFYMVSLAGDIPLMFDCQLLAKAAPDEWFYGIGHTNNLYVGGGIDLANVPSTNAMAKVNQVYLWGLTRANDDLWVGTGPNINLLIAGTYTGSTNAAITPGQASEFGYSAFARAGIVPPELGDWRPSDIFAYSLPDGPLTRLNDNIPTNHLAVLHQAIGLRSAGTAPSNEVHTNGIVILAGPNITQESIILIAFDAGTRACIGTREMPGYINIRKWLAHENVLYTSVTTDTGDGVVLRWINDPQNAAYPLAFKEVGQLDNGGAEMAIFNDRLFVGTWPGIEGTKTLDPIKVLLEPAGIFRSPVIPDGGLTSTHLLNWEKVWDVNEYDPDIVCAAVTGIGALHEFEGELYWGTMHVPGTSFLAHNIIHGEPSPSEMFTTWQRTSRTLAIFRDSVFQRKIATPLGRIIIQNYHTPTLLYGEPELWARDIDIHYLFGTWTSGNWAAEPTGFTPLYGASGFDNDGNTYTWTMGSYQERLFVGTLDVSGGNRGEIVSELGGADLWCFESGSEPARQVSARGAGNYASSGIRTMVASEDGLYLGMINPNNLLTDLSDEYPEGGWELIRLRKTFNDADWDNLDDGWETEMFGSTTNNVPGTDSDGDTCLDEEEFIAGTHPLNSNDFPCIEFHDQTLEWYGVSNRFYSILYSPAVTGNWQIAGVVTGANETIMFNQPETDSLSGFFRTEVRLDRSIWELE